MNLAKLDINDPMMLPDNLFGRRWIVACRFDLNGDTAVYSISEESLPETTVIWGVLMQSTALTFADAAFLGFRLADQAPATDAAFQSLEQIFRGISNRNDLYDFAVGGPDTSFFPIERKIIRPTGRRLVVRGIAAATKTGDTIAGLLISSIPRDIPECLLPSRPK